MTGIQPSSSVAWNWASIPTSSALCSMLYKTSEILFHFSFILSLSPFFSLVYTHTILLLPHLYINRSCFNIILLIIWRHFRDFMIYTLNLRKHKHDSHMRHEFAEPEKKNQKKEGKRGDKNCHQINSCHQKGRSHHVKTRGWNNCCYHSMMKKDKGSKEQLTYIFVVKAEWCGSDHVDERSDRVCEQNPVKSLPPVHKIHTKQTPTLCIEFLSLPCLLHHHSANCMFHCSP